MTTDQAAPEPFILGLPRLRPNFLPAPVLGLWPGLPRMPKDCWQPAYAWSPAQAASCLSDHEATHDLPARSWLAESLQKKVSPQFLRPDEESALAAFTHNPALAATAAADRAAQAALKPEAAQSALILAWLQEGRVLEMARLRLKLAAAEAIQQTLFTGESFEEQANALGTAAPALNPDEESLLPPWSYVLRAAALFLPEHCQFYCADQALATLLKRGGEAIQESPLPDCHVWKIERSPLPGMLQGPARLWHIPLSMENPA